MSSGGVTEVSCGQLSGLDVVVLRLESVVVVVYWQTGVQFTLGLFAPFTVAVRVVDWPKMRFMPEEEVMVTVMTLAALPLPPQPDKSGHTAASPIPTTFQTARNFTPTIFPPTCSPVRILRRPHAYLPSRFLQKSILFFKLFLLRIEPCA